MLYSDAVSEHSNSQRSDSALNKKQINTDDLHMKKIMKLRFKKTIQNKTKRAFIQ